MCEKKTKKHILVDNSQTFLTCMNGTLRDRGNISPFCFAGITFSEKKQFYIDMHSNIIYLYSNLYYKKVVIFYYHPSRKIQNH